MATEHGRPKFADVRACDLLVQYEPLIALDQFVDTERSAQGVNRLREGVPGLLLVRITPEERHQTLACDPAAPRHSEDADERGELARESIFPRQPSGLDPEAAKYCNTNELRHLILS
jgi:hypothetical protein